MPELVKIPREGAEDRQMSALQEDYTISHCNGMVTQLLAQEPALGDLLSEAVSPLRDAFGDGRLLKVRAQQSDDDSLLKVAVQLPADFDGDAERALSIFDKEWWIKNCHRSCGSLVFDYEIQDAV